MNINGSAFKILQLLYENKNDKTLAEMLLESKSRTTGKRKDLFVRSSTISAGTYTSISKNKYISKELFARINADIGGLRKYGEIFECDGTKFTASQIPKIDGTNLKEVKAEGNVMNFGLNNYFKYISSDGKEHLLYTSQLGGVSSINTEDLRGEPYDETLNRYAEFWKYMISEDPVYIGLSFTGEQIKTYLAEAGVKPGFFTVKMGEKEATQFYSTGETSGIVYSKERYDVKYNALTSSDDFLSNYTPGDVFTINDKEYILSDSHTLNIPYGEDIYNIKYPSNYYYGRRLD